MSWLRLLPLPQVLDGDLGFLLSWPEYLKPPGQTQGCLVHPSVGVALLGFFPLEDSEWWVVPAHSRALLGYLTTGSLLWSWEGSMEIGAPPPKGFSIDKNRKTDRRNNVDVISASGQVAPIHKKSVGSEIGQLGNNKQKKHEIWAPVDLW